MLASTGARAGDYRLGLDQDLVWVGIGRIQFLGLQACHPLVGEHGKGRLCGSPLVGGRAAGWPPTHRTRDRRALSATNLAQGVTGPLSRSSIQLPQVLHRMYIRPARGRADLIVE